MSSKNSDRVLAWVNKVRAGYGKNPLKKLPKGKPRDSCHCVVARALKTCGKDVAVSGPTFSNFTIDGKSQGYPDYIGRFISDFDRGYLPELVKKAKPA